MLINVFIKCVLFPIVMLTFYRVWIFMSFYAHSRKHFPCRHTQSGPLRGQTHIPQCFFIGLHTSDNVFELDLRNLNTIKHVMPFLVWKIKIKMSCNVFCKFEAKSDPWFCQKIVTRFYTEQALVRKYIWNKSTLFTMIKFLYVHFIVRYKCNISI